MTGDELKQALAALDMPQRQFAIKAGVSPENVNRWVRGRLPVPQWVEWMIELLNQPNRFWQKGAHIDSLPVENNTRGTSGVLMPESYTRHGEVAELPPDDLPLPPPPPKRRRKRVARGVMIAVVALLAVAGSASAKMVCEQTAIGQSCVDKEGIQADWIRLYCGYHPGDPDCQALGYKWASADPVDQAVDRRLTEHFCAANPTLARCQSPFEFERRKAAGAQR